MQRKQCKRIKKETLQAKALDYKCLNSINTAFTKQRAKNLRDGVEIFKKKA